MQFYSLALRSLRLIIELHYHPFLRDDEVIAEVVSDENEGVNSALRHAKGVICKDIDNFEKRLKNNPVLISWLSVQWCLLVLRALRLLAAIHFHVDSGEKGRLPSLSKPKVKEFTRVAIIDDMNELLIEMEQQKEEVAV